MRQDNLPDYGIPGAAWPDEPLAPTTVIASRPVDSSNYYGSVGYDYDDVEQDSYTGARRARRQPQSDAAEPDAIQPGRIAKPSSRRSRIAAAFDPPTQTVTLARQGNERENNILSNQTTGQRRFATGRLRHAVDRRRSSSPRRSSSRRRWPGSGPAAPATSIDPNPLRSGDRLRAGAHRRLDDGPDEHGRRSTRSTPSTSGRWQVNGGFAWSTTTRRSRPSTPPACPTTDLARLGRASQRQGRRAVQG